MAAVTRDFSLQPIPSTLSSTGSGGVTGEAMDIVVHAWGGRCCTIRDPFGNLFDLIDANQKGDA